MACELSVEQIAAMTGGQILSRHQERIRGVGTDTRVDLSGKLFVALVGDRFDAHDFLRQAADRKAAVLLVHKKPDAELLSRITCIQVSDTLKALQDLANAWRKILTAKVVGITGSNGKTSTKEFTAAIASSRWRTSWSKGSFNNHWGVPLSLLQASREDEVVVLEMGMNHSGEITVLAKIAEPDLVVVTMVGTSHIGELGSQAAIAAAKEEIYLACPKAAHIFNIDNEWTIKMWERDMKLAKRPSMTFSGFRPHADVFMRIERMTLTGVEVTGRIKGVEGKALVPIFGRHNVVNLMAAAAINCQLGMDPREIWSGLTRCQGNWGRNQLLHLASGAQVLFDGYNANPDSMAALLKNLLEISTEGRKIAILGEMLELGADSERFHAELGELVGGTDVDAVWFVGGPRAAFEKGLKKSGYAKGAILTEKVEEKIAQDMISRLAPKDLVVIKGSRGIKLEKVLEIWKPIDYVAKS